MPPHPPGRVDPWADDPWGFGASDSGAVLERSTETPDPVGAAAGAASPAAAAATRAASSRSVAAVASMPKVAPPWPPAGDRRPPPPARSRSASAKAVAPSPRRHPHLRVALVVVAAAIVGAGGSAWYVNRGTWLSVSSGPPPAVTSSGVVFEVPSPSSGPAGPVDGVIEPVSAAAPAGEFSTSPVVPEALVSFDVPFEVRIYENGGFVGTNTGEPIRVAPGRHTFALVNELLGFRTEHTVLARADRPTRRVVGPPTAPLSLDADPWAEVFVAGRRLGQTPIDSIPLPVGIHQVTLRHPTLGEREVEMTVRLGGLNRLAVDMRR